MTSVVFQDEFTLMSAGSVDGSVRKLELFPPAVYVNSNVSGKVDNNRL